MSIRRPSRLHLRPVPPRWPSASHGRRVLVVVQPPKLRASLWALEKARVVAQARNAGLAVVVVSPPRAPGDSKGWLEWLTKVTGDARLQVRVGHVTMESEAVVARSGAELLVVGAPRGTGGHWARLARRLSVPVLVARPPVSKGGIVAATDFTDERFPVLTTAHAIAPSSDPSVLMLHNVDPGGEAFHRHFGRFLGARGLRKLRDLRADKLHAFARVLGPSVCATLSTNRDVVSAVEEHAMRRSADVVVVGAHGHAGPRQSRRRRTADRIIERVPGSVLVLPLPPHGLMAG